MLFRHAPVGGIVLTLALLTAAAPAQKLTGVKAIAVTENTSFALLSDGTVWWWGQESVWSYVVGGGQSTPVRVSGLTDVFAISPPLALKADGTVWQYSVDVAYPSEPVRLDELSGTVAVAAGGLALKSDGTVWDRCIMARGCTLGPVSGLSEVVAVARLRSHSLALKRDGTVWEWGELSLDGLTVASSDLSLDTPAQVTGLTDVVAVAAGYGHSLALKSDGTVWAWGFNGHGELGDGATQARTAPVQVSALSGVVKIAAGHAHSIAMKRDGTVWTWGSNVGGQLGDGTTADRLKSVQVSGLSGITAIAGGRFHSLALKDDGTVWAWGVDQFGELGDGVQLTKRWDRLGPFQVGGISGVANISGGLFHSLALRTDGTVWAWGANYSGALGDGTRKGYDWPGRSTPMQVSGLAGLVAVAGALNFSLAVARDGSVWKWGEYTGIPNGGTAIAPAPTPVSELSGAVSASGAVDNNFYLSYKSAVNYHLAVRNDGSLWEWGVQQRQDGRLLETSALELAPVAGLTEVVSAVTALNQNLALKRDGTVWEWGIRSSTPKQVSGLAGVVAVAAACSETSIRGCHSLALKRNGTVWAWGDNSMGQLGNGTPDFAWRTEPEEVAGLSDVVAIATRGYGDFAGTAHSVAVKRDGTVWEWPVWESYGQLKSLTPAQVAELSDVIAVAEGGAHSLALKSDGTVWAWGQNVHGQLGARTFAIRTTPVQVGLAAE